MVISLNFCFISISVLKINFGCISSFCFMGTTNGLFVIEQLNDFSNYFQTLQGHLLWHALYNVNHGHYPSLICAYWLQIGLQHFDACLLYSHIGESETGLGSILELKLELTSIPIPIPELELELQAMELELELQNGIDRNWNGIEDSISIPPSILLTFSILSSANGTYWCYKNSRCLL